MRYFVGSLVVVAIVVIVALGANQGEVQPDPVESLVDAAGEREPSIFDTHDYGPAPSLGSVNAVSPPTVEETFMAVCETYGHAVDDIVDERFPRSTEPVLLARDGLLMPSGSFNSPRAPRNMDWECEDRQLTVVVGGPWTLGARDMEAALSVLLGDLRNRELSPLTDGVVVVLESALMDEPARFDGAQVQKYVREALMDAAGGRKPGTSDDGSRDERELGDQLGTVVVMESEPSGARGERQRAGRGATGRFEPRYDAQAQPWESLQHARIAKSSDDCVGYCFDAIVESVDGDDARVARVVVFGEGGAPSRAVVERTRMSADSRSATYSSDAVHFSCFERANAAAVPRFEGCAQMVRKR